MKALIERLPGKNRVKCFKMLFVESVAIENKIMNKIYFK